MANSKRRSMPSAFAISLAIVAINSEARPIRVDFGSEFNTATGALWNDPAYPDLTATQSTGAVNLDFDIDFGTGAVGTMFINENGFVSFGSAVDFASGGLPAGTNYIAPFYADLQSTAPADPLPSAPFQTTGEISYSTGILKQAPEADGTFTETGAQDAFRVTWWQVKDGAQTISAQLVLVHVDDATDPNAFDIEFNYGFENTTNPLAGTGLVLGTNALAYGGPYTALGGDATFSFRNGALTTGTPTPVPEPSMASLLVLGLSLVSLRRLSRRRLQGLAFVER